MPAKHTPTTSDPTGREDSFYYADGKKVPLARSKRFVSVKTPEAGAAGPAAANVAAGLSTISSPAHVFDLPEYNLAVIALPDDARGAPAARSSMDSTLSALEAQLGAAVGPPVYETADSPMAEALVPVGEVLAKFKPGSSSETIQRALAANRLKVVRADYPEPGTYLLKTADERDAVAAANRMQESGIVEFAQPNFVHLTPRLEGPGVATSRIAFLSQKPDGDPESMMETLTDIRAEAETMPAAAPPGDPGFASQWGLKKIKAPEAFDISMGSAGISVAIIDEGCDLNHEDIVYRTPGFDAFDGDDTPQPNGNDAHGTACAGIASAGANNAKGGAGVAPSCKVLPIRIAQGVGGGFWSTTDAKIADGIRTAVDRGADVLSNSWGSGPSTVVTNAFQYAQTNGRGGKGCPIAAATGNDDVRGVIYPATLSPSIPGFLAVGASNEWDQRKSKTSLDGETWWGSNYGPEVDVVAPGVHIYTADIMGGTGYGAGNYVANFNGTSSATPHVAGLMALILSVDPGLRSWEVEDIIKLTADDLGPPGRDEEFGFGRINCRTALEAASRLWYEIQVVPEFLGSGRECYMRMNVRIFNPGINTVRLDGLTVTSHTSNWTAEIDRLEYRPTPGGLMAPRSGNDVRLNRILLKANGNQSSWSYRWGLAWSYTFWRPAAPGFPLAARNALDDAQALHESRSIRGGSNPGRRKADRSPRSDSGLAPLGARAEAPANGASERANGDSILIDRQSKTITVVIR